MNNVKDPDKNEICDVCGKARSGKSGSLTQWLVRCACGEESLPGSNQVLELAPVELTKICKTCGKALPDGRAGSMTQWIFRVETCKCSHPALLFDPVQRDSTPATIEPDALGPDELVEEPLDVDAEKFPCDRYDALEVLGEGQNGVVYRARDRILRRQVAIKTVRTTQLTSEQVILFQREAKATSQLTHRNIIHLYDFGITDGGIPFLVMEYARGHSLLEMIERTGPLPAKSALPLLIEVARGMEHAHQVKILHRDLKSSNILLIPPDKEAGQFWSVKIIDFGLAALPPSSFETHKTKAGAMLGSPAYMSPEQARGKSDIDERSDIYSLGSVLFECITGRVPFEGQNALETMISQIDAEPPTIMDVKPDVEYGEQISQITLRALKKRPEDRFQSMTEFKECLKALLLEIEERESSSATRAPGETFRAVVTAARQSDDKTSLAKFVVVVGCVGVGIIAAVMMALGRINQDFTRSSAPKIVSPLDEKHNGLFQLPPVAGVTDVTTGGGSRYDRKSKRFVPNEEAFVELPGVDVAPVNEPAVYLEKDILKARMHMKDADLKFLEDKSKLPFIHTINLRGASVTGTGFKYLLGRDIQDLDVSNTILSPVGLDYIGKMSGLRALAMSHVQIDPSELTRLKDLKQLTTICLVGTDLTDDAVRLVVEQHPHLSSLDVGFNPDVTDACVPYVLKMDSVNTLYFKKTGITGDGMIEMAGLPLLTGLFADCCRINEAQFVRLIDVMSKKNMLYLAVDCREIPESTLVNHLPRLDKLIGLTLSDGKHLSAKTKIALKRKMRRAHIGFE